MQPKIRLDSVLFSCSSQGVGGGGGVEGKFFPPSPFLHSPSTCKDEYRAYVTINFKMLLLTRKI